MKFLVAVMLLAAATAGASGGCLESLRRAQRAAPERPRPREVEDPDCDTTAPVREHPAPAHDGEQQGTRVDTSVFPQQTSNNPPTFSSSGSSYGGLASSPGSSYGGLASSSGSNYGGLAFSPASSYGGLASSSGSSYGGLAFSPGSGYGGLAFFPGGQQPGGLLLGNTVVTRTRPAHATRDKTGASSLQAGQLYSPTRQLSFSSYLQPAFQNNYGFASPLQSFGGFPSLQAATLQPAAASSSNKAQFPSLYYPGFAPAGALFASPYAGNLLSGNAFPTLTVRGLQPPPSLARSQARVRPQDVSLTTARPRAPPVTETPRPAADPEESSEYSRESEYSHDDDEDDSSETSGEATEELPRTSQSSYDGDPEDDGPDRATSFAVEDIFKPSPKDYYSSSFFHGEEPFGPSRHQRKKSSGEGKKARGKSRAGYSGPGYPGDSEVQHSEYRPAAVNREITQEDKKRDYYSYSVVTHKRTR